VVLHTVLYVGQVECHSRPVLEIDGRFYVAEQSSRLLFDPFSGVQERLGESGLGIRIESVKMSYETDSNAARLLDGCFLVCLSLAFGAVAIRTMVMVVIMMVMVVVMIVCHFISSYTLSRF
jgi:hypothetical protein